MEAFAIVVFSLVSACWTSDILGNQADEPAQPENSPEEDLLLAIANFIQRKH
jgi:hypothetical protein